MSIKFKLVLNAFVMIVAVGIISGMNLQSLFSIKASIGYLTENSTPLQVKNTQLQQCIEKLSAEFLRLGMAQNTNEAHQISQSVDVQIEELRKLSQQIQQLDNGSDSFNTDVFAELHTAVANTLNSKLKAIQSFEEEADSAGKALRDVEGSLANIHHDVVLQNAEAFNAVRAAQQSNLLRNNVVKQALSLQYKSKTLEALLGDIDGVHSKDELNAVKDRIRTANDDIQGVPIVKDEPAIFGDVRSAAATVFQDVKLKNTGLLALRTLALSDPTKQDDYAKAKIGVITNLRAVTDKLTTAIDPLELQLFQSREAVDRALQLQEQTDAVVGSAALLEMKTKELNTGTRLIMLSHTTAEWEQKRVQVKTMLEGISAEIDHLQHALETTARLQTHRSAPTSTPSVNTPTDQPQPSNGNTRLAQKTGNVQAIVGAIQGAHASIEKILTAKKNVLTSDTLMQQMFARIRLISNTQAQEGNKKLETASQNQTNTVSTVNERVKQSLSSTLTLSAIAAGVVLLFSLMLMVSITRSLNILSKTVLAVAAEGDFSRRVPIRSRDEVGKTVQAFNRLMDSLQSAFSRINTVMNDMAQGDFDSRVDVELTGDLHALKTSINTTVERLQKAISNINEVMEGVAQGDFARQIHVELHGELKALQSNINTSVDRLRFAIQDINRVLNGLAQGDFSLHVSADLSGELDTLKGNINQTVRTLRTTMQAQHEVMQALAFGDFKAHVHVEAQGEFKRSSDMILQTMASLETIIGDVNEVMSRVARGDLTPRVSVKASGAFQQLADGINTSLTSLQTTLKLVHNNTLQVSIASSETSTTVEQVAEGVHSQSGSVDHLVQAIEKTTHAVGRVLESTNTARDFSQHAATLVQSGQEQVETMLDQVRAIAANSDKISSIAEVITSIVDQTQLLALNAAIEAARAGEHGRGFTVVAQEVNNLANQVNLQAIEIKALVTEARHSSQGGLDVAQKVQAQMGNIVQNVLNTDRSLREITTAMAEQTDIVHEMETSVHNLRTIAESDAAAAERMASSMGALSHLAEQTRQQTGHFKVA